MPYQHGPEDQRDRRHPHQRRGLGSDSQPERGAGDGKLPHVLVAHASHRERDSGKEEERHHEIVLRGRGLENRHRHRHQQCRRERGSGAREAQEARGHEARQTGPDRGEPLDDRDQPVPAREVHRPRLEDLRVRLIPELTHGAAGELSRAVVLQPVRRA
jgi:hypothetical protein